MTLAERTLELCSIASPIGDEAALAAHVHALGGASSERVGNSVVYGRVSDSAQIVLFGHLDTVPLQQGDFPARRADGRIYGRGASDMKGALAVMIELWRARKKDNFVCVFYDREEGPYETNGLGPLLEARKDLSQAKLALCLEPTDLALQLGCCGSMHATFTFHGRSAHSARPWQGENAIHKAGALLTALQQRGAREVKFGELTFREVMNVTRIEGFTGRNVIPARCELNVNFRFAPGKSVQAAEAELQELAHGYGADCAITDRAPSGPVILDNPHLQRLRAMTGVAVEPKQAWTDVARLALHGIPAANFGPGEQAQAHQKNESCAEAPLDKAFDLLQRFLGG